MGSLEGRFRIGEDRYVIIRMGIFNLVFMAKSPEVKTDDDGFILKDFSSFHSGMRKAKAVLLSGSFEPSV